MLLVFTEVCMVCLHVRTASASLTAGVCHEFCTPMPNYRSKYSSPLYDVQTIFLKHKNTHHILQHTHVWIVTHAHKSESMYSSVSSWSSGKTRESWKQLKHFESNLRIARQLFPFDLLDTQPV